jgi:phosphatidylserine/phosphatidylglycerophosphate/cardiolipin synthase-like enzyme
MLRNKLPLAVLALCSFLIAGCGGGGNTSTGATTTTPGLSTSTLTAFTAVSGTSSSQTLTLTNTGTATFTLTSAALGGTNPAAFSTTGTGTCATLPASLAPNATCTLTITFAPTAAGPFSATITLTDNVAGLPQTITLSGTGTAPGLSLSSLTAFTAVAGTSTSQSLTLTNNGTAPFILTSAALGGTNPTAFTATSTCGNLPVSLAPSSSCSLTITFAPTAAGPFSATVTFADNVAGSPQIVTLSGTGTAPALSLSSLTAFSTAASTTSTAQTLTLTNSGTAPLTFSSEVLGGTNSSVFAITSNTCNTPLAISASCALTLTFSPTAGGSFGAMITLTDNVSGSPQIVSLSGTGLVPVATLSGNSLAFSSAPTIASPLQFITLTNTGTATLNISSITLGGTNPSDFAIAAGTNPCGTTLAASASCTISASFTPADATTYAATITVTDNATGSPQIINLSGTGTAPVASFSPGSLTFAATNVGVSSASQSFALTNTGNAALTISNIAVTGTAASSYSQTNNCTAPLVPTTGNCTVYVTFDPTTSGPLAAAISFTDNASGSPQTVGLSGTGIAPIASLGGTTLNFSSTPTVTSPLQFITLTNTGTATLNISSIALGGTNASDFAIAAGTNPCGTTLAPSASCTISATFTPTAATTYTASITVTDDASTSPQVITLNGNGGTAVYRTLFATPMSDNSITPLYNLINSATQTIDMTMYELQDTTFSGYLVAACAKGVKVRVILSSSEKNPDTPAYTQLNGAGSNCKAVFSNTAFTNTHQKTITIDAAAANATTAILSLNLQSVYYSTTRDFGIITNDAADIAAIEATFAVDYAAAGTNSSTDFNYPAGAGDDLVWSPTTATADMVGIIANAKSTLYIECEEFSAPNIIAAIATAAQNGVKVVLICENESSEYNTAFTTVKNAGATVYYYSSSTGFYVHAKAVVADLGLSTEAVYMGSINYSTASLTKNRELGVYITGNTTVSSPIASSIQATIISDETGSGVHQF